MTHPQPVTEPRYAFETRNVNKVFAGAHTIHALTDINLRLTEGSFTCIVGPSGCGKSTLLRILGNLEQATSGEIISSLSAKKVPTSAFVFQEHGVFPWFNVLQNVAFGEHMAGAGKREREENARHWIAEAGLAGFEASYPHQLSGGMRQRIAIARAFATGSPSLLMDEPLGALDAQTRMLMQEELIALWEQERKTVLMVTHDIDEAIILSDRVIVMSGRPGTLREDITVPFERPRSVEIERTPEFSELRSRIWNLLREDARTAEETA